MATVSGTVICCNHDFSSLPETEGECPVISLCSEAQEHLGYDLKHTNKSPSEWLTLIEMLSVTFMLKEEQTEVPPQ